MDNGQAATNLDHPTASGGDRRRHTATILMLTLALALTAGAPASASRGDGGRSARDSAGRASLGSHDHSDKKSRGRRHRHRQTQGGIANQTPVDPGPSSAPNPPAAPAPSGPTPAAPVAVPAPPPITIPEPVEITESVPLPSPIPVPEPEPIPTPIPVPTPTPTPPPVTTPTPSSCTTTVTSTSAVGTAVARAAEGAVVCLADGTYGKLSLNAMKSGSGVTVRPVDPAGATIAGASLSGSDIRLAEFVSTGEIEIQPGASKITIEHNRITGGGEGIDAGPTTTTSINDIAIIGNQLIGPFGEDAIHLNRYHDGDGDGVGILIEGNEITGVRENGNHSDCLQTVWTGDHIVFRRNYLHDNRCQGFFIKDQDSLPASVGVVGPIAGIAVEDNLFLRDTQPCASSAPGCGQPNYFQVFGPYSGFRMTHNTIWGDGADSLATFREGTGPDTVIGDNVIYRLWTDTDMSHASLVENTVCQVETSGRGAWPASRPGETKACSLAFVNPGADDYRLATPNGRGIDWAPSAQHYGP